MRFVVVGVYNIYNLRVMKQSSLCLLSALGGALVGAMFAMLVTPTSGKELRHKIRDYVSDAESRLRADLGCNCDAEAK